MQASNRDGDANGRRCALTERSRTPGQPSGRQDHRRAGCLRHGPRGRGLSRVGAFARAVEVSHERAEVVALMPEMPDTGLDGAADALGAGAFFPASWCLRGLSRPAMRECVQVLLDCRECTRVPARRVPCSRDYRYTHSAELRLPTSASRSSMRLIRALAETIFPRRSSPSREITQNRQARRSAPAGFAAGFGAGAPSVSH